MVGCNSAAFTAQDALKDTDCQVFQAMRMKAMANATTRFRFPLKVELDMHPLRKTHVARRRKDRAGAVKENEKEPS